MFIEVRAEAIAVYLSLAESLGDEALNKPFEVLDAEDPDSTLYKAAYSEALAALEKAK
jgi:hypothetical protein